MKLNPKYTRNRRTRIISNGHHCGIREHQNSSGQYQVEGIDIEFCHNCEVHFSTYDPHESQVIYQEDYYSGVDNGYGDYALEIKTHKATFSKRLKFAESYLPEKGVLLDYGCAIGHLCMVSKEMGWKTLEVTFLILVPRRLKLNMELKHC